MSQPHSPAMDPIGRPEEPQSAQQNVQSSRRHEARFGKARRTNMGEGEAWLSLAAGAGLVLGALRSWSKASIPLAAAGASLLYRGSTGHCPVYSATGVDHSGRSTGPDAVSTITINKSPQELYEFWRDLTNAPRFMSFVESVEILGDGRSRWRGKQVGGRRFDYEAEITEDIPGEGLRWRSVEGAPIQMRGSVRFAPAPADRGATVIASVVFGRPGSDGLRSRLAGPLANYKIHQDLMRLKQLMEAGEIATTENQPSGRSKAEQAKQATSSSRRPVSVSQDAEQRTNQDDLQRTEGAAF